MAEDPVTLLLTVERSKLEMLWNLVYNVTVNNLELNRETDRLELRDGSGDETVIDPLSLEHLVVMDEFQNVLWAALHPREDGVSGSGR